MSFISHMARRAFLLAGLIAALGVGSGRSLAQDERPSAPKLVVVVVVDGLGEHQLDQFRPRFKSGLKQLLDKGAWFTRAEYGQSTTVTATGHATIVTGAYAYRHGQVSNEWFDPRTEKEVYCCEDPAFKIVGEVSKDKHPGTSPRNLLVTTIGDELRLATGFKSRVFGVSMKDRGAILPAGKGGTAYFFSSETGRFVTSSYYLKDGRYSDWWTRFHAGAPQNFWFQRDWQPESAQPASADPAEPPSAAPQTDGPAGFGTRFPHRLDGGGKKPDATYYKALLNTPYSHQLLTSFCGALLDGEGLGNNPAGCPDLLAVSYSSHDYINHRFGPESPESEDDLLKLDGIFADFLGLLDRKVGLKNVLLVLTSDHGFSVAPGTWTDKVRLEADRIYGDELLAKVNRRLRNKFGFEKMATAFVPPTVWLDYELIDQRNLGRAAVEEECAAALASLPGVHSVYTRTQLERGEVPRTRLGSMVSRTWHPRVSGDVLVIQKDGWMFAAKRDDTAAPTGATHGSPWEYDTRVPVVFLGDAWVKEGRSAKAAEPTDIAPTLAEILRIPPPSGCEGRVLTEILK
jgi:hypothetical protein